MSEEPIRVSSEAWTGIDKKPTPVEQPKSQRRPNRLKGLIAALAMAILSGREVVSAITEHIVHRRANFVSRVTLVRQGDYPTLFSWHASVSFVMLVFSTALTIAILIDFWREKIRKQRSWFDTSSKAQIDKGV